MRFEPKSICSIYSFIACNKNDANVRIYRACLQRRLKMVYKTTHHTCCSAATYIDEICLQGYIVPASLSSNVH